MAPNTVVAVVVSVIGVVLMLAGALTFSKTRAFVRAASSATATVTGLVCDDYASPEGDLYYYAVVQFPDPTGEVVTLKLPSGTTPPPYDVGQHLSLLYDAGDPRRAAVKSFRSLWYCVVALLGAGATFAAGGIALLASNG
jgi:hypothetical protein